MSIEKVRCRFSLSDMKVLGYGFVKSRMAQPEYEVGILPTDVWAITFSVEPCLVLRSSQIVCVSKETGDIVYDGWCYDEG